MATKTAERKPTIHEIAAATRSNQPHFFTRSTNKFFRQRMSDFKVLRAPVSGRIFIAASRPYGVTFREFTGDNLRFAYAGGVPPAEVEARREAGDDIQCARIDNWTDVYAFVEAL